MGNNILGAAFRASQALEMKMSLASRNISLSTTPGAEPLRLKESKHTGTFQGVLSQTNGAHLIPAGKRHYGNLKTEINRDAIPTVNGNSINVDDEMTTLQASYAQSLAISNMETHFLGQLNTVTHFGK